MLLFERIQSQRLPPGFRRLGVLKQGATEIASCHYYPALSSRGLSPRRGCLSASLDLIVIALLSLRVDVPLHAFQTVKRRWSVIAGLRGHRARYSHVEKRAPPSQG